MRGIFSSTQDNPVNTSLNIMQLARGNSSVFPFYGRELTCDHTRDTALWMPENLRLTTPGTLIPAPHTLLLRSSLIYSYSMGSFYRKVLNPLCHKYSATYINTRHIYSSNLSPSIYLDCGIQTGQGDFLFCPYFLYYLGPALTFFFGAG